MEHFPIVASGGTPNFNYVVSGNNININHLTSIPDFVTHLLHFVIICILIVCKIYFTCLGESTKNDYFCNIMFVRKRKNRSGTTSVVVIDKSGGSFRELKTIGVSSDDKEITALCLAGKRWIAAHCGKRDMFLEAE